MPDYDREMEIKILLSELHDINDEMANFYLSILNHMTRFEARLQLQLKDKKEEN